MPHSFLTRPGRPSLAYRRQGGTNAALPAAVFLTGLKSDMSGTKAEFLAQACAARGQNYVRFDYSGHGLSEGVFEDGTIGQWFQDALDIIDSQTEGPVILIGSSMGGWIGLLCMLARRDRVAGYAGLAAAPDFTRDIKAGMTEGQKIQLETTGRMLLPNDYGDPYIVTKNFLEDGERHCLLHAPVDAPCPVRLMQGMKDADVPWQTAHRIAGAIIQDDKKVYLRENGDHRLSSPDDLALLDRLVCELSGV